ncbi:hypothetical protein POPTR_014G132050v4 [Populus trichocarpa]|uniref:Uncharacterized protein n=1 Tax=Populus trichocarpa TaxID=3694 RepID=A0ACC0RZH6_POPTR|nr:hypothetical protein POPTR_014G132050v4 [Populus trichocarpa]
MTFLMVSFSAKLSLLKGHISTCVSIGQAEYEYHFKHIVLPFPSLLMNLHMVLSQEQPNSLQCEAVYRIRIINYRYHLLIRFG